MILPDFLEFEPLNQIRRAMNADLADSVDVVTIDTLTDEELRKLTGIGIDIFLDEIKVLTDSTLAYKNARVVLYIRDWTYPTGFPKYHVSDCDTLQGMRAKGRSHRYVVASREDGIFSVNIMNHQVQQFETKELELAVCKNCLNKIQWKKNSERQFSLEAFFNLYPKLLSKGDFKTDSEAPLNHYSSNWQAISDSLRASRNWKCQNCGMNCITKKDFLHVHHINGIKSDNSMSNLKVLCKGCHALEPGHEHLIDIF